MNTNTTAKTTAPVAVGPRQMGKTLPAGSTVYVRSLNADGTATISDGFRNIGYVRASALVF